MTWDEDRAKSAKEVCSHEVARWATGASPFHMLTRRVDGVRSDDDLALAVEAEVSLAFPATLAARGHEMVGIDALDESGRAEYPFLESLFVGRGETSRHGMAKPAA